MATELLMPKLGLTMTEGTIDEWKKKVGDKVHKGDIIYSVATDKLTNDVEAEADGVLLKILVPEGETVPCRALIGWLGAAGAWMMADPSERLSAAFMVQDMMPDSRYYNNRLRAVINGLIE